jgi:predicted RNase H-like HicB family nuclease
MKAKVINVVIREDESGLLFASSPDLAGFRVAGRSLQELEKEIPAVIQMMMKAQGVSVSVIEAEANIRNNQERPWIALPVTELAHT